MGLLLGRFVTAGSGGPSPAAPASRPDGAEAAVAALQDQLRAAPDDPTLLTRLGVSYLTRARETADPSYFTRAAQALERSRELAPDRPDTLTGLGLLALGRHEFPAALELGRRAHELDPASPQPLGVVVDAHVELGRYDEATDAAQEMLNRRPALASLSRASFLRELHGDTKGAVTAMTQAAIAGAGSSPADVAYVEGLLGDLHLGAGALPEAEAAYRRALDRADAPAAEVGLARVAAARGDLAGATAQLEEVTARLPQPAWVALLGDVLAAQGRTAEAGDQYRLVRLMEELNRANGVAVDLELARFEADHARDPGVDPQAAVALARAALDRRPTVFGEDALGWALRQAGRPAEALPHARAAVRLGTADALLWYHLAAVEADLGEAEAARADLTRALSLNPHLTVRDLPEARALAARLNLS
jgi:tetratricopeptide (TPR) repeat protein